MNRIAVCLITCDRASYTQRTVSSFIEMNRGNEMERFDLLHADDASTSRENEIIANLHGFIPVAQHKERLGVTKTIRHAVQAAARRGAGHVLVLENDWESVRPFPWDLFDYFTAIPVAYCLRMCGEYKEWDEENKHGRRPFGKNHAGRAEKPVAWAPLMDAPEPAEMGAIHWGNPPAVTRTDKALWLLDGQKSEREVRMRSGDLPIGEDYTLRPALNVFFHIGANRTPDFKR